MPNRSLEILSVEPSCPYFRYEGGLKGLMIENVRHPASGRKIVFDGPTRYLVTITRDGLKKLNEWNIKNCLGHFYNRSFYITCTIGYPDTPEQIAYDGIDQTEDIKSSQRPRKTRKRPLSLPRNSGEAKKPRKTKKYAT